MICPKCGRRTYKDEAICPKCGADMYARPRAAGASLPRVQVKKPTQPPESAYTPPTYTSPAPEQPVYTPAPKPEPVPEPVRQTEPINIPEPVYTAPPVPEPAPQPKEDLDRTLTFAAIKDASEVETAAVREYNRMKAQLRESKVNDDGSKVTLERLPEGYVYVKMSIDEADRMNRRKEIPKPLIIAVAAASVVTIILMIVLWAVSGTSSTPLIVGKWQGEIEPSRFGISGIPFTSIDTVWEFEKNGDVTVTPQDALLAGYELSGTYELAETENTVELELIYNGEKIEFELLYSIDKGSDTLTISSVDDPKHSYPLKKQK